MRTTANACLVALALLLAVAGSASATTRGIWINTPLTTQTGTLTFRSGARTAICNVTITKTFSVGLVPVNPAGLTRIGRVTSISFLATPDCQPIFLNIPTTLGGIPVPGPLPNSWDIGYLSSDLATGNLRFGILDVQVSPFAGVACLYRGALLGTLRAGGPDLTFNTSMSAPGCADVTITGQLFDNPPVQYVLLNI